MVGEYIPPKLISCGSGLSYEKYKTLSKASQTAVIKETLRVSAVITSRLPLMAPNELQYHDWMIPPRVSIPHVIITLLNPYVRRLICITQTPVSLSSRTVLHDPSIFPSPHEFKPERWLAPDSEKLDRYFVAFGKGTRMCQGMK